MPDLLEDVEQWQPEARGGIRGLEEGRRVAVAPRGSGSGWVGDDPGPRIESNREEGPKRERRPALRHARKGTRVGFYLGGPLCTSSTWKR